MNVIKCKSKLDHLRWFSQSRRPTQHFGEVRTQGAMTPKSNSAEIFVQHSYPQVSSSCVYSFGSYRVDKQTNKRRWKHTTLFATLRLCVTIDLSRERVNLRFQVEEAKSAVDDEVRARQKLTSENRQLQVSFSNQWCCFWLNLSNIFYFANTVLRRLLVPS